MMPAPAPHRIFDPVARRQHRQRAGGDAFDAAELYLTELIEDRLDAVQRSFTNAAVINTGHGLLAERLRMRGAVVTTTDPGLAVAQLAGAIDCTEDALPFAPASFDLIIVPGGLDAIDDLPGALVLMRRALQPDGLFMAVMTGAPTLPTLRRAIAVADGDQATARVHPMIEVRAGGDLLVRAGFALPVADVETVRLTYHDVGRLIDDLRALGVTNALVGRRPVDRGWVSRLHAAYAQRADADGRIQETVSLMVLTGWAPDPGQPLPARRGSATASLSAALSPRLKAIL